MSINKNEPPEKESKILEPNTSPSHGVEELEVEKLHVSPANALQSGNSGSEEDWDLTTLRLDQHFDIMIGAQQILTAVRVRKPSNQEWFRVHPNEDWRLPTAILRLKDEGEDYLVHPNLRIAVWEEIQPVMIFTAINRQREVFLWPIRLPRGDGRTDQFMETDLVAAKEAEQKWTRRQWVPENRTHKISVARNLPEEPNWPEISFQELIKKAFKDRFICDLDHPVLKQLRGEE